MLELFVLALPIIQIARRCMRIYWVNCLSDVIPEAKCKWKISIGFTLQRHCQADFHQVENGLSLILEGNTEGIGPGGSPAP
ncbi:hypothetical protein D3C71_1756720 [compost metagenome]